MTISAECVMMEWNKMHNKLWKFPDFTRLSHFSIDRFWVLIINVLVGPKKFIVTILATEKSVKHSIYVLIKFSYYPATSSCHFLPTYTLRCRHNSRRCYIFFNGHSNYWIMNNGTGQRSEILKPQHNTCCQSFYIWL